MPTYAEFFLNSKANIIQFETLEISHSEFSQVFYAVRNDKNGMTATLENASEVTFVHVPMRITPVETRETLDFGIKIEFGDLGEILPQELDLLAAGSGFVEKPVVKYRTFRSDDLTAPMFGPVTLEIDSITFAKDGAFFVAKAPSLNINKTGERYSLDRFPMLRGFL